MSHDELEFLLPAPVSQEQDVYKRQQETLNLVFDEISFEMGFNGEKYELILTPERCV